MEVVGGVATVVGTTTGAVVVVVGAGGGGAGATVVTGAALEVVVTVVGAVVGVVPVEGGTVAVGAAPVEDDPGDDFLATVVVDDAPPFVEPALTPVDGLDEECEGDGELADDEWVAPVVGVVVTVPEGLVEPGVRAAATAAAAAFSAAATEFVNVAAEALVFAAVALRADTMRRSLASVALSFERVCAFSSFWRDSYAETVVVVVVVGASIVEPT